MYEYGVFGFIAQGLSMDSFRLVTVPQPSSRYLHIFSCSNCVFSSLSAITLSLDRLCQHISIDVACVDAEGGSYSASHVASAKTSRLAAAMNSSLLLSQITMSVPLSVSAWSDEVSGMKTRGLVMLPEGVSIATTVVSLQDAGPVKVTVQVS